MGRLSIVVPAYNEEENIRGVLWSLVNARDRIALESGLDDVEIIVVDDGSSDATPRYLREMLDEYHQAFRVVTHEHNKGYGAALKTGLTNATGQFLSFMDADGTLAPETFVELYRALVKNDADLVVGTRFGGSETGMPFLRKLGNRFFALLLSFLSGERVGDSASGMRLFRREIVSQLLPLPDGLHFTPAMSTKAIHEKLRIVEVPIPYAERGGASKLRVVSDGLRFLRAIVQTVMLYNPFKVFLLVGLLFEMVAAALFSLPFYALLTKEDLLFSDYIYRSIGGLYFFTAGIQIILFGILARFIVSTFFRRHEGGRVIHRLNHFLRVYDWMGWYGAAIFGAGIVINALYFRQYLFEGGLQLHWAWLLLAAGFIIVGLQMIITGVVMMILRDIRAARIESNGN